VTLGISHPGKMGDLLYAWPVVQALAKKHNAMVDFYTSEYCRPLIPLLEYQPEVEQVIIPSDYRILDYGTGVQPWSMNVPTDGYVATYELGMRGWPDRGMIQYYADMMEVKAEPYHFDCPETSPFPGAVIVSSCPRLGKSYVESVIEALRGRVPVVYVGWEGEEVPEGCANVKTPNLLETATMIRNARAYAGGTGVNSVLAIAFYPVPCVVTYPDIYFDTRHLVPAPQVRYLREPTVQEFVKNVMEIV